MINELVKDKSWSVYKSFMPNALQPKIMDMDRSIRAMNLGSYNKLVGTPTKLEERLYYKLYANNTVNALRLKGEPTEYVLTSNENIRSCEDSVCTVFPAPETELDVKTHFEPVEVLPAEGEKSPDNPSTIKGWREIECTRSGVNLCKLERLFNLVETDGVYTQVKEDNGLDGFIIQVQYLDGNYENFGVITGSTTRPVSLGINKLSFILRKPIQKIAIKLTCSGNVIDSTLYVDVDHIKINKQYTAQINVTKIDGVRISFTEPQIEPCSTATPYTPYEGDTYTVDLGEEYGGGYVDWARGVFVKEWGGVVFDGTENLKIFSKRYYMIVAEGTTAANRSTKCSHFVPVTGGNSALIGQDNCSIGGRELYLSNTDKFQNVDILKSWLAAQYAAGTPVKLVYKLETPVEHPITPTLIKSLQASDKRNRYKLNNIFSNTNLPTQVKFKGVAEDVNIYDTA